MDSMELMSARDLRRMRLHFFEYGFVMATCIAVLLVLYVYPIVGACR